MRIEHHHRYYGPTESDIGFVVRRLADGTKVWRLDFVAEDGQRVIVELTAGEALMMMAQLAKAGD